MIVSKKLWKIISDACVYFTAAEFLLLIIAAWISELSPETGGGVRSFLSLGSSAWIFLSCLIMSLLNLTFKLDLSFSLQLLIHFIGSVIAFGVVFIIVPGAWNDFSAIFVRLGAFAAVYFIIAFIAVIIRSFKNNSKADEFEYEPQFGEFFNGNKKTGKK